MRMPQPVILSVESPPGGGKGFLLKYLASRGLCTVLHSDAISHVMDFNADPRRWAFFTELFFLDVHVRCCQQAQQARQVVLVEGSPVTDRLCYFEAQQRAHMHPLEAALYEEWYSILRPHWRIDHALLLLSDTHSHMERIIDNSKVEQGPIGLEHVHAMTAAYMRALPDAYILPCPANFEDNEPVLETLCSAVMQLATTLQQRQQQQQQQHAS